MFLGEWKKYLLKELEDEPLTLRRSEVDIEGFKIQDNLNSNFWDQDGNLKTKLKERLLRIAENFLKNLNLPFVDMEDVTITGSLANYNWSKYSDIDLHIILDFSQIDENKALVKQLFDAKRSLWNRTHKIMMHEHEVEIYVQDTHESHASTGVYSVLNSKWNIKPSRTNFQVDWECVKIKTSCFMNLIDDVASVYNIKNYKKAFKESKRLKEKIKKFRSGGLRDGGAYSVENLAFKLLRRNEYMGKLLDLHVKSYDKLFSLDKEFKKKL